MLSVAIYLEIDSIAWLALILCIISPTLYPQDGINLVLTVAAVLIASSFVILCLSNRILIKPSLLPFYLVDLVLHYHGFSPRSHRL
jgi:hypothetical protein